ncbi:23S rRNA (adenine(1618)-N(6))-methyltransferase RlmF [Hymenobacter fodinae]|uniref:Ribosomal RNA large subunit methyltransferase F n=1 Tax=Hymenobacter fodinae TaxID=2510796 RepID=A0A4Z0P4P0_9BACT|nr:23S rRNA (adenine(1618)-N(6))-methyltransferase RlmF [Hymenobacter fodinae]TGE06146.1 23S rRNA (adenine(1618)-N(6))-methyltransferase RlmF [Hymenobacter fodinae]
MHPRNPHNGRYDFPQLLSTSPELAAFVVSNPTGDSSIDFANPAAVKALNRALLKQFYGVASWDVPAGYLCPPIPGRADYIHYAADLLAADHSGLVPRDKAVHVLDVGVGANCVYPIIGSQAYGWRFVGSEIDSVALKSAKTMVAANPKLTGRVEIRQQSHAAFVFEGIVKPREEFDLVMCNPPFHASAADAAAGSRRKGRNLGYAKALEPVLNFGGQNTELWCEGGEEGFLRRFVEQSVPLAARVLWFSILLSKKETLRSAYYFLQKAGVEESSIRTIEMKQGQKTSRIVAWTFQDDEQRQAWARRRWKPVA